MFVKTIDEALDFIRSQKNVLENKLDESIPAFRRLETYPSLPKLFSYGLDSVTNAGEYNSSHYFKPHECKTVEQIQIRIQSLLQVCDAAESLLVQTQNDNVAIINHNKKVVEKVRLFMSTVGIPSSFSYKDPKSRARNPKPIAKSSGYVDDILRHIPTSDSTYTSLVNIINRKREELRKWAQQATSSIVEMEKVVAQREKVIKKDQLLATLKVKYSLPFDSDEDDVEEAMLSKCQYLRLASAMEEARVDFSKGYRVENALATFDSEKEPNKTIHKEISELCDDYEGDGRVFRDCDNNFGVIYGMVATTLYEDWMLFKEMFRD